MSNFHSEAVKLWKKISRTTVIDKKAKKEIEEIEKALHYQWNCGKNTGQFQTRV